MNNLRVLIIDDEEELVSTLIERLSYRGITASGALNGQDGIALLARETFDVVVLDLKLPGISGLEVLRQLQVKHPEVKVIIITGHGSTSANDEDIPPGAYDYLPKPVDINVLIAKMNEAVRSNHE